MSILPIIYIPDPVLKEVAQPVGTVDDDLRTQMDNMLESMYDAPGIGLAANQVGLLNRVFVMDLNSGAEDTEERTPICMVNPEIIWRSEEPSGSRGCRGRLRFAIAGIH